MNSNSAVRSAIQCGHFHWRAACGDFHAGTETAIAGKLRGNAIQRYRFHTLRRAHLAHHHLPPRPGTQHCGWRATGERERGLDDFQHRCPRCRQRHRATTGAFQLRHAGLLVAQLRFLGEQLIFQQLHQLPIFLLSSVLPGSKALDFAFVLLFLLCECSFALGQLRLQTLHLGLHVRLRGGDFIGLRLHLGQRLRIVAGGNLLFLLAQCLKLLLHLHGAHGLLALLLAQAFGFALHPGGLFGQFGAQFVQLGEFLAAGRTRLFQPGTGLAELASGVFQLTFARIELTAQAAQFFTLGGVLLLLLFHRLLQFADAGVLGLHFQTHGGGKQQVVVLDAGSGAVQVQRLRHVLFHTQAFFVQVTQIDLRAAVALIGRLAEPKCGHGVIRRGAKALGIDLAHHVLRLRIPAHCRIHPHLQRGLIVGAVVGDVFTAANLAIRFRGADGPARAHEAGLRAELANLPRQQAIHDQ